MLYHSVIAGYLKLRQMIKAGLPVFFGSDVGKFSDSGSGIMDTALFEYEVHIRLC